MSVSNSVNYLRLRWTIGLTGRSHEWLMIDVGVLETFLGPYAQEIVHFDYTTSEVVRVDGKRAQGNGWHEGCGEAVHGSGTSANTSEPPRRAMGRSLRYRML